ncbi:MAG: hypothetical protein EPO07_07535 [Verrucomicrobia bacterium]|nr:MAG: hypothetical protein EPO07_07535 [Verrucomicrobiota bacterium]
MSDFFSNLVSRARAAEPALRPNLASPFEPSRHAPAAAGLNPIEEAAGTVEATPSPSLKNSHPRKSASPAEIKPGPVEAAPETAEPASDNGQPAEISATRVSAPTARRAVPAPCALPASAPATASPEKVAEHSHLGELRKTGGDAEAGEQSPAAASPEDPSREASSDPLTAVVAAMISFANSDAAGAAPTLDSPESVPKQTLPTASAPARLRRAPKFQSPNPGGRLDGLANSDSTPGAVAPTVQVTIGRLEIRAVTPPAAGPGERPLQPAPRLSLDDYLRRSRNGGAA